MNCMKQSAAPLLSFSVLFLMFCMPGISQTYKFRQYGLNEGICHPFVYTVNQDVNGYIWLGTGNGLCKYDGKNFYGDFDADSLPAALVKKSFRDSRGNLWFGHDDGSITFYDGRRFRVIDAGRRITSTINDIAEDSEGRIVFATQNQGLIIVTEDFDVMHLEQAFDRMRISSIAFTGSGQMLMGGYDGLHVFSYDFSTDTVRYLAKVSGVPYTQITDIVYNEEADLYWLGSQGEGLFALKLHDGDAREAEVTRLGNGDLLAHTPVLDIFRDSQDYLWLSTGGEGLYKVSVNTGDLNISEFEHFNSQNGLGIDYIREAFEDLEGNMWVATYGNGLAALFDEAFTFYDYSDGGGKTIYSVLEDTGGYWMGGRGRLTRVITGLKDTEEVYGRSQGLPDDRITALYKDAQGTLWIGTGESGLYRMRDRRISRFFSSENSLENTINAIDAIGQTIWLATSNGVVTKDLGSGLTDRYGLGPNVPHNQINDLHIDSNGTVWIATKRSDGLYSVNTDQRLTISGNVAMDFVSITEDDYGNLWAATANNGVFRFLSDTLEYYSVNNGLKNASCYSILNDGQGNIWVGHRLGLSKIEADRGVIVTYGTETGINGDIQHNASSVTDDGQILFGTSDGLIRFDTGKERNNITPPITSITSVVISDTQYDFSEPIVLPYNVYKLRVDFIGLNYFAPDKVTYQYTLDGYDEWSEPTSIPYVQYSRIEDGDYTFMLRACNSEGVCTELPVEFSLRVKLPVWKTWWFIGICVLIAVSAVYVIIKFRERKARQFQEMLQRRLDERTHEVVMQKEEIEIKNKDITDSINYAQRIQASILPPISKLHEAFSGSFVFYQPRDIVSGDFYWYDRTENDKFVIVCADSTGHGVPGAFMSMIGTTLIKDITIRKEVDSPAALLAMLDQEIMAALNQNIEAERSNDGMDIIVSEIDLKTNKLKISSAMRPMIIYREGEQIYVRGSRSSVGGQYEKDQKVFETHEYEMKKGDKIYMFSDGYPDQFGGPLGKKFKMVRLKNMLRDIHEKPMDEQYNYIKNNFEIWKEDMEQVDDVLFMGIEI